MESLSSRVKSLTNLFASGLLLLLTILPSGIAFAATPTVVAGPTTNYAGAVLYADVANGPGNLGDWVGLFRVGQANGPGELDRSYLSFNGYKPTTPSTSYRIKFWLPTTPGTYELRFEANDGYTLLATSQPITILPYTETFNANDPTASGYALSFSDDFTNPNTIDVNNTKAGGFKWYMGGIPASAVSFQFDGLHMTRQIGTAEPTFGSAPLPLVGQMFGGGGYFEANLWFDPSKVDPTTAAQGYWPAFWGASAEIAAGQAAAPGKPPGYMHFGEFDFMEYGALNTVGHPFLGMFWQTTHDWYGVNGSADCPNTFCEIGSSASSGIFVPDVTGWHRYGALWVPATPTSLGYTQAYFDGQPVGPRTSWSYHASLADVPTPPTLADKYSIFDFQHWIVVLTANLNDAMIVRNVKIWQIPGQGSVCTYDGTTASCKSPR